MKKDAQVILMLSEVNLSSVLLILFSGRLFLHGTKVSTPRCAIVPSLGLVICPFPDSGILSSQVVELRMKRVYSDLPFYVMPRQGVLSKVGHRGNKWALNSGRFKFHLCSLPTGCSPANFYSFSELQFLISKVI